MSLEAFRELVNTNDEFFDRVSNNSDIVDMDNGSMIIHRGNMGKYLEKYMCKNEDDLSDTLWYGYGVFVKVID